jgi:hypothetical protein
LNQHPGRPLAAPADSNGGPWPWALGRLMQDFRGRSILWCLGEEQHQQAEKRTFHHYYCINLSITSLLRIVIPSFPSLPFPSPLRLRSPFEVPSSPPYSESLALGPAPFVLALLCAASHCCLRFQPSPSPRESVRIHACDIELFDQSFSFSQSPGRRPVLPAVSRLCWTPLH